jgi:Zn-dependent peptidase ImmA (M78 family)
VNGSVSYKDKPAIWKEADNFRDSADLRGHNIPPIDVIYIAEVILKLDIIPLENLFAEQSIDAALLPDLTGFYIDEEAYMGWERGTRWVEQRLRFSFAHELGHLVLHSKEIKAQCFKSLLEFKQWAATPSKYGSPEIQANEFAGRLLVPLPILQREYDQLTRGMPNWREIEGTREFFAKKIAPRFGVNYQVIETRFDHEGIWPAE